MRKKLQNIINNLPAAATLLLIFLVWYGLSESGKIPAYMLPSPKAVVQALISEWDLIGMHLFVTLQEAMYGLAIGIGLAFITATVMDYCRILYQAIYPIMVITQTIPTVAIAPILVLWMGFNMAPKIALVVLTTFFPITVGLLDGYRSIDKDCVDLLRSMGANEVKIFRHVKLPGALPYFFAGLKISVSYAVVGAVIAEWLGGFEGLGVYMTRVRKAYAYDRMFAVILVIVAVSLLLMWLVNVIRKCAMPWERVEEK